MSFSSGLTCSSFVVVVDDDIYGSFLDTDPWLMEWPTNNTNKDTGNKRVEVVYAPVDILEEELVNY